MHLKQKEVAGWMIPPVNLIVIVKKTLRNPTFSTTTYTAIRDFMMKNGIKPESTIRLQRKFMQNLCKPLEKI
jgi:hypothetical protein